MDPTKPSLPELTPEEKARLAEEGKAAAKVVGSALAPIALALLTGAPVAWATVLWPLIGTLSKIITPADVALALKFAVAAGKISLVEAKFVLFFVQAHVAHPDPRIDPNDPATWDLGAPPLVVGPDGTIPLTQTPVDPLRP